MSTFQGDDIDKLLDDAIDRPVKEEKRRRRKRSRSRSKGRRRRRSRSRSRKRDRDVERRYRDFLGIEKEKERRYHKAAERHRRTVFGANIHPKVDEFEIFEFFSEVGKVLDIQLLRDSRSFRSKGLCYVEFEEVAQIPAALSLNGKQLGGYPIVVQLTQGEKNIAAQIANDAANSQSSISLKISNLPLKVHEEDLRPVFEAFGDLEDLYLKRSKDNNTREGYVEFAKQSEGIAAFQQLNGLEILDAKMKLETEKPINISALTDPLAAAESLGLGATVSAAKINVSLEDESGNGALAMTSSARANLMSKLHGGAFADSVASINQVPQAPQAAKVVTSTALLLKNMFNPSNESDPDFDLDIREDVMEEVQKYGALQHIYVDKTSTDGRVYLRFRDENGATNTFNSLNKRWFGQNQIEAEFIQIDEYVAQFPDS